MNRLLVLVVVFCGLLLQGFGSEEVFTKFLRGSQISPSTELTLNPRRYDYTNWTVVHPVLSVRLYLAEDRWQLRYQDSQCSVVFTLDLVNENNVHQIVTDTLSVNYFWFNSYKDIDVHKYIDVKAATLTVMNTSGNLTDDIFLEMQLLYPRFTQTENIDAVSGVWRQYKENSNELLITWNYKDGADEYDLEWLFVDNPANISGIPYDFRNATRITTSNNYYSVTLAYPKGTILYRIRGRGTHFANNTLYPVVGPWSFSPSNTDTLPPVSTLYRFDYNGLEDSLTWQYTASFAEDGKRAESISFYDGSLRKRQEVALVHSDSLAVVSEYFYDHVGRQALHAIPAPTPSQGIRYYGTQGASHGLFNGDYGKNDYDADSTLYRNKIFPNNAGSAIYYSANNPFVNSAKWPTINQTPFDSGYTYSHTRYMNDGTNRVHSQSMPGSVFKLGGGRETKYIYGNPSQSELDRLFGNEVGDASHYQKVISMDANGEVSVSYYDMKERLIASAIVPSVADTALLAVDSSTDAQPLTDIISFNESNRVNTRNIAVGKASTYDFQYSLLPASPLCDTCGNEHGCIDCRYLVIFSLWDSDNLQYIFRDSVVLSSGHTLSHNYSLLPGNYQLYKSVSLLEDENTTAAFQLFANRNRSCVHYDSAAIALCYTVCEEYAMQMEGIPSPDTTNPRYVDYLKECQHQSYNPNTECEAKLEAMLADMSPGGQYFDNIKSCCPFDTNCFCDENHDINGFLNSICKWRLDEDTSLRRILQELRVNSFGNDFWDSLRYYWKKEYAEIMLKYHPEYHLYKAFCDCGNKDAQSTFDSIFFNTNSFAEAKQLGLLNPVGLPVDDIPAVYKDMGVGYLPYEANMIDPFFDKDTECCRENIETRRSKMADRLLSYISWNDEGQLYISLWFLLFNPSHEPVGHSLDSALNNFQTSIVQTWADQYGCSLEDAQWRLFRSIYLYLRDELKYKLLPECLQTCNLSNPEHNCEELEPEDKSCCNKNPQLEWGQYEWWTETFDPKILDYCEYFLKADTSCSSIPLTTDSCNTFNCGYQIRFLCNPVYALNFDNYLTTADSSQKTVYRNCCADCEAYANVWMADLHDYLLENHPDILFDTLAWIALRQKLISWCIESCDSSRQNYDSNRLQRFVLDSLLSLFGDSCFVVLDRRGEFLVDCGCNNYQAELNAHGLTFWSTPDSIVKSLSSIIDQDLYGYIADWNHYCMRERYLNMLEGNDDTTSLYELEFPEAFRCYPDLPDSVLCQLQAILDAAAKDTASLYRALDSLVAVRHQQYESHCMDNVFEQMTISNSSSEFLYTLYYYDQADNLIKTIPPEGVCVITDRRTLDSVAQYRRDVACYDSIGPGFIHPKHTMATNYRYNTLNQVVQSYLPDHDSVTVVYYDILSRPVLSQNAEQRKNHKYSYTLYDDLGRIIEIGQVQNANPITPKDVLDNAIVNNFINVDGIKSEITVTYYDEPLRPSLLQKNLRNRIAATAYYNTSFSNPITFQTATHYGYDIHGNINCLIHEIPDLSGFGRKNIMLDYEYDLISGNINKMVFQNGFEEQVTHRYRYDADNRLTHVYTSNTAIIKELTFSSQPHTTFIPLEHLEARYFYLPNGLLSRIELGRKQIQGIDYAYTLQGWLKDINGYRTVSLFNDYATYDMGMDCYGSSAHNRIFAQDVFASSLMYYQGDYAPVAGNNYFNKDASSAVSLYNGNIAALTTGHYDLGNDPLLKLFRYDKLNRIKQMRTSRLNELGTNWTAPSTKYSADYTYDYNGNFRSLQRYDKNGQILHNMRYKYFDTTSNRLSRIVATGINAGQFYYDAVGNLKQDDLGNVSVTWNSQGKVQSLSKGNSIQLEFRYSPDGHRQVKQSGDTSYYYLHDATGNVMCIYKNLNDTLTAIERPFYGSKRLGEIKQEVSILPGGHVVLKNNHTIGLREYEMTDHLGNVMATCLDRKHLHIDSEENLFYEPYITMSTDYYPFGLPLPARSAYIPRYRYFFNGQEADNEVYGSGVSLSAEFWQYDSRLGRRWNVDPVFKEYESPYACFAGNPVRFADRFGADIGWVKDADGNVFWDEHTNSIEDFNVNYANKVGFQYVSDIDDYKSYMLPNGNGKLVMNHFGGAKEVRDGYASVWIDLSFIPADEAARGGWMQTYSSNLPDVHSGDAYAALPLSNIESERLDGGGVADKSNVLNATYFCVPPSFRLEDMPIRKLNEGSLYEVSMIMQSSLLLNNHKELSIKWGFIVTGDNSATTLNPTITNSTSDFHNKAIKIILSKQP